MYATLSLYLVAGIRTHITTHAASSYGKISEIPHYHRWKFVNTKCVFLWYDGVIQNNMHILKH